MGHFRVARFTSYVLLLFCGIALLAFRMRVQAQAMSPVVQEFNKKARGTVQASNNGDVTKTVSCQAHGFDADEHGTLQFHPLSDALHVRIAAERVVLEPKGSRQVSFDATPAALPAWFVVTCRFMPVERSSGLTLAMEISAIVIVQGKPLDPRDVTLSAKHVGTKVEVEVKNNGPGLARVSSGEIFGHSHSKHADLGNFILFPRQKRLVDVDWKETALPETVRLQIGKKRLEAPVN
jgi:hypothetical protein